MSNTILVCLTVALLCQSAVSQVFTPPGGPSTRKPFLQLLSQYPPPNQLSPSGDQLQSLIRQLLGLLQGRVPVLRTTTPRDQDDLLAS